MAMNGHTGPPGHGGTGEDGTYGPGDGRTRPDGQNGHEEYEEYEGHGRPDGRDGLDAPGGPDVSEGPGGPDGPEGLDEPDGSDGDDLLPCGRSLYAVWEDHETGADPATDAAGVPGHPPADCPHCSAALQELRALDDFVQRARSEEQSAPQPDAAGVAARVMDLVRLELRPGRTLPLGEPDEAHWIVEAAAAKTLRAAAETVPGVRAGSCRVAPAAGAKSGPRGPVRVTIEVEAGSARALPALADAVRTAVAGAADRAIGIRVAMVDVAVVDIFDEDADEDGGGHAWETTTREGR
ncbi:hypothetical protein ACFYVL_31000 [Streptomyces sp. NPDC004111]|uniref:hypothetical protein n=1 Tax=Streptomyces sp. NPDC004111 TaxID=3364690 RepID=UPI00368FDB8E